MSEIWEILLGLGDKFAEHIILAASAIGLGILVALPLAGQALAMAEENFNPGRDAAITLGSPEWHAGVVGIVASCIAKKYHRPTFIIAFDEDGIGKGSGRSVKGISLIAGINECRDLLIKGGGHEMAAGITIALTQLNGSLNCTGFLVNNTAQDCAPLFMTANHCELTEISAPSLVTYWNHENSTCRQPFSVESGQDGDGSLTDFNSGSVWRAAWAQSDFTIVELDDPVSPSAEAFRAGWNALDTLASNAEYAAEVRNRIIITICKDGRPQSSDVHHAMVDSTIVFSVLPTRAKVFNIEHDERVVYHASHEGSYLSFDGSAEVSPIATETHGPAMDILIDAYRAAAKKEHPNWDEFRDAMIRERRRVITVTPTSVVGLIRPQWG